MKIEDLLARRSDLSTFLVHLTRTDEGLTGKQRLQAILNEQRIRARSPLGHAVKSLERHTLPIDSQRCVCFTETPLQHVSLLLEEIEGRSCSFEPYGIAFTRKQGRRLGVNPVWYVDITPGHTWLSKSIEQIVESSIVDGNFDASPIARLAPFVEQMGTGSRKTGGEYRKEFWWEREWRHVGDVTLPDKFIILCPADEIEEFELLIDQWKVALKPRFVDPRWSLEQIIARLAGIRPDDVGPF